MGHAPESHVVGQDYSTPSYCNPLPFTTAPETSAFPDVHTPAPLTLNEVDRLKALNRLGILGTAPEPIFDTLTRLGASFFNAPVCLITLVDEHWQFMKSAFGTARFGVARGESFCAHTILDGSPLVVPDSKSDPRFAANPYTSAPFDIRFYAGAPLITSDGFHIGAFCVIDHLPRHDFGEDQIEQLKQSARLATLAIEERLLTSQIAHAEASLMTAHRMRRILESTSDSVFLLDHNWRFTFLNEKAKQCIAEGRDLIGRNCWEMFPASRGSVFEENYRKAMRENVQVTFEERSPQLNRIFSVQAHPTEDGLAVFFRDVTELHEAEQNRQALQKRFELATQFATDGIWDWDANSDQLYCSARVQEIFGLQPIAVTGRPTECLSKFHPADLLRCRTHFREAAKSSATEIDAEYRIHYGNGVWRWISTRTAIVRHPNGRIARMAGSISDITEKKLIDPLTGLHNRISLIDRIEEHMDIAGRSNKDFALFIFALDEFRNIVNSFGSKIGDSVLREVAERLSETVRVGSGGLAAYLGGDEFAILMAYAPSEEDAATYANALTTILSRPIYCKESELVVSGSIGIAMGATSTGTATSLLENAGVAMCQTRERGNGTYTFFREQTRARVRQRMEFEVDLRRAIDKNELVLHFQPKVLLETRKITGFEALVRWMHPKYGLVAPSAFIPSAEQTGFILDIGSWTLIESMRQLKQWRRQGLIAADVTMAVNLSTRQFKDPTLISQVQDVLVQFNLPSYSLALEVTESALIDDAENARRIMDNLRAIGVSLHLDDFGTGYSSLSYLHRFPFQCLKIDRSFINELCSERHSQAIVKSILHLGSSLKMSVVAEGIESSEQANLLQAMGCIYGQGFLYSRPIPADDVPEFLSNRILTARPLQTSAHKAHAA